MESQDRTRSEIKASLTSAIAARNWPGALQARESFLEAAAVAHESFEITREHLEEFDTRIDEATRPALALTDALEAARTTQRMTSRGGSTAADADSLDLDAQVSWLLAELGFAIENAAWTDVRALAFKVAASVRVARSMPPGLSERLVSLTRVFESARAQAEEDARPLPALALALVAGREAPANVAESIRACLESSAGLLRATEAQNLEHLRGRVLFVTQARDELGVLAADFACALSRGDWADARRCESRLEPLASVLTHVPTALAARLEQARDRSARILVAGQATGRCAQASLRLLLDLGLPEPVPQAAATWLAERSWFFDPVVIDDIRRMHAEASALVDARARERAALHDLERGPAAGAPSSIDTLRARVRQNAIEAREAAAMTEYHLRRARRATQPSAGQRHATG